MTLSEIINPWGALRRLKVAHAWLREEFEKERARADRSARSATEARNAADNHSLTAMGRAQEIDRLRHQLRQAHFRNPKTGRIGRRGETFQ